ncbi:unnamed protein product [Spodoptera exigua]|nr:unnamed protein product [Spodoptera exigua]
MEGKADTLLQTRIACIQEMMCNCDIAVMANKAYTLILVCKVCKVYEVFRKKLLCNTSYMALYGMALYTALYTALGTAPDMAPDTAPDMADDTGPDTGPDT